MKYIAFDINEINMVLTICKGEVMRYEDMEKDGHPNEFGVLLIKAKWQGKVEALEEILKFGKEIELDEIH
jgi:hypothetical protein